jgi:23S rRNA G2445 N2-methylase RlmL
MSIVLPRSREQIARLLATTGYTPAASELTILMDWLGEADDRSVERALARAGERAAFEAIARFDASAPPLRARLVAVVGRIAVGTANPDFAQFVRARLDDLDPTTRRRAVSALGKLGDGAAEPALLGLLERADTPAEKKVIVEALGKVGTERSLLALEALHTADGEEARVVREALAKLRRSSARLETSRIDLSRRPEQAVSVLLHVRAGLERLLVSELGAKLEPRMVGPGRVGVRLAAPLETLFSARTFLHLGFPLAPCPEGDDAVVSALTSPESMRILRALTAGPIRYRIEWADKGHRRAATYRVAEEIAKREPDLVNDPRSPMWEAVVTLRNGRTHVELWPVGVVDARFAYRVRTVPASSHPTIAAALARLANAEPRDVVWDPFVGAGAELVERAQLGPCRALYGSDVDGAALDAARANLDAAGVKATLALGDARSFRPPEPVTLLITNPPMGRRLMEKKSVGPMLERAFESFAWALAPTGRVVWVAPPGVTIAGFSVRSRVPIDMGGFTAEIQVLSRRRQ